MTEVNGQDDMPSSPPLLPRPLRRWGGVTLLLALLAALYVIAVRGTVILYDIGQGLAAICF
jgi:hypothetical protein